jgi:hypothetical protein
MLVSGDREWLNRRLPDGTFDNNLSWWVFDQTIDVLLTLAKAHNVDTVIEGCARGADYSAEKFAEKFPLLIPNLLHFPARWDTEGRSAGPLRNIRMLDEGKPDFVVAFHDNLEQSKGTRHMVSIADDKGIPVFGYSTDMLRYRLEDKRRANG